MVVDFQGIPIKPTFFEKVWIFRGELAPPSRHLHEDLVPPTLGWKAAWEDGWVQWMESVEAYLVGGCNQPIWKILVKFPQIGMNIKYLKPPPSYLK